MTRNRGLALGLVGIGLFAAQWLLGDALYHWNLDWDLFGWTLRSEIIRNGPKIGKLMALAAALVGFYFYLRKAA
jgi:hypothetical protein